MSADQLQLPRFVLVALILPDGDTVGAGLACTHPGGNILRDDS